MTSIRSPLSFESMIFKSLNSKSKQTSLQKFCQIVPKLEKVKNFGVKPVIFAEILFVYFEDFTLVHSHLLCFPLNSWNYVSIFIRVILIKWHDIAEPNKFVKCDFILHLKNYQTTCCQIQSPVNDAMFSQIFYCTNEIRL